MFKKLYQEGRDLVIQLYAEAPTSPFIQILAEKIKEELSNEPNNLSEDKKVDDKENRSSSGHTS
jgi:hypothetical protein